MAIRVTKDECRQAVRTHRRSKLLRIAAAALLVLSLLAFGLGFLATAGCAGSLGEAIEQANDARLEGEAAASAIRATCGPLYRAIEAEPDDAAAAAAFEAINPACLGALRSYRVFRLAHAQAVALLDRARQGDATEADVARAVTELVAAAGQLRFAQGAVQ